MGCFVIWVGNDGAVTPHERLYFEPKGKVVGEVMLILPEGEIVQKDGDGEEYTINLEGKPPELVAMQVARDHQASLTVTAPAGYGLDRVVPLIAKAMNGYRHVRTEDFADPVSSA